MYLVTLKDQLGNQMFAYVAIKCLAKDKNIEFGVLQEDSYYINSSDEKYGNDLISIFNIPKEEIVEKLPDNYEVLKELPRKQRIGRYWEFIQQASVNTLFDGHFISCKYFTRDIEEIRSWFCIPEATVKKAEEDVCRIKKETNTKMCCSVHFRVGQDYRKLGYLMDKGYWFEAARKIKQQYPECSFIVFYDKKSMEVQQFIDSFRAADMHGSLVDDMAGIAECDLHIVCNSTFSIMSALISKNDECVIRPTKYYSGIHTLPDDVFPNTWEKCECKRNIISFIRGIIYFLYVWVRKSW